MINKEELKRRQKVLLDELIKISEELILAKQKELHRDIDNKISFLEIKKRISHESG